MKTFLVAGRRKGSDRFELLAGGRLLSHSNARRTIKAERSADGRVGQFAELHKCLCVFRVKLEKGEKKARPVKAKESPALAKMQAFRSRLQTLIAKRR